MVDYGSRIAELLASHRLATTLVERERMFLEKSRERESNAAEAQQIVQGIAQAMQQRAHRRIAEVVSRCLLAVFDDPYEFKIRWDRKRGKTEAVLMFARGGVELDDPLNEVGGGVVDVASLALRLAKMLMEKPLSRRLLVLDEPFRNVRGEENRKRTRQLLEELASEMGFQFIINTDVPAFRMGTVVDLG